MPATTGAARWQRSYVKLLIAYDSFVVAITLMGEVIFGVISPSSRIAFGVAISLGLVWLWILAAEGAHGVRFRGPGARDYRQVALASGKLVALVAVVAVVTGWRAHGLRLVLVVGAGVVLLLLGRRAAREVVARKRADGQWMIRVLAVGDRAHTVQLIDSLRRHPEAGLVVVGVCTHAPVTSEILDVPVVGDLVDVRAAAAGHRADVVAVTAAGIDRETVQSMAWALEGADIDLVLVPSLAGVAAPRVSIRPVADMAFVHIDEPTLGPSRDLVKSLIDRTAAALGLLVILPVLVAIAIVIRIDSAGPVIFKQTRVGRNGESFRVWKFRSMTQGAEVLVADMQGDNESDGHLFKLRADPRVTRAGTWLRRWSLDELPQLVNVLKGEMSLVGPRPLPVAADRFQGSERRRMLVKPGITGLWQVSGRSDIGWDEAVKLDLYYVENWSLWLDLAILWKTASAVTRSDGAY